MSILLSTVQQSVDRSFFISLYEKVLEYGYLPDRRDTALYPNTITGENAYKSAINSIISEKGFAIRVVGSGTSREVGIKDVPLFVISSSSYMLGDLGGDLNYHTEFFAENNEYKKRILPPQSVDFYIDVHIVCNSITQYRIMTSILALALPMRYYLPFYDDATRRFLITIMQGAVDISDSEKGLLEYIYKYKAHDLYVQPDIYEDGVLKPLKEISIEHRVGEDDNTTAQVIN